MAAWGDSYYEMKILWEGEWTLWAPSVKIKPTESKQLRCKNGLYCRNSSIQSYVYLIFFFCDIVKQIYLIVFSCYLVTEHYISSINLCTVTKYKTSLYMTCSICCFTPTSKKTWTMNTICYVQSLYKCFCCCLHPSYLWQWVHMNRGKTRQCTKAIQAG